MSKQASGLSACEWLTLWDVGGNGLFSSNRAPSGFVKLPTISSLDTSETGIYSRSGEPQLFSGIRINARAVPEKRGPAEFSVDLVVRFDPQ